MASPLAEMGQIPQAGATVQNTYSTRTLMGNWREEKFDDDLEKKKKRAIRALNPPGEHWQTTYGGTIGSPMPQPARKAPFRPTRPSLDSGFGADSTDEVPRSGFFPPVPPTNSIVGGPFPGFRAELQGRATNTYNTEMRKKYGNPHERPDFEVDSVLGDKPFPSPERVEEVAHNIETYRRTWTKSGNGTKNRFVSEMSRSYKQVDPADIVKDKRGRTYYDRL
jgi:hypothetical protein